MKVLEVQISKIKIGQRFRKDMGDVNELAQSIDDGLLQPIGITPEYELIFGERRLRACRDVLGRETIPARIVEVRSVLLGQITENSMRKDFTPSELVAIVDALRSFRHGGDRKSDQALKCDVEKLTVDEAAKRAGLGGKDGYNRAKSVVEKGIPELVQAMDSDMLSIAAASKLAGLEPEKQRRVLEKGLDHARWFVNRKSKTERLGDTAPRVRPSTPSTNEPQPTVAMRPPVLNEITQGDCRDIIPLLPDRSVNLCLCSPPYADQRKGHYPGIPEKDYPQFTVDWMDKLSPKLADDASVLIVIRTHIKQGVISDYVLRTRLLLREVGWKECETLIWHKKDGGACMGSMKRPRRTYEEILWFSKTHDPYVDVKACGGWSNNVSFRGSTRFGMGGDSPLHGGQRQGKRPGRTRITDLISAPVGGIPKGIDHSAMFPVELAEKLIQTFCPKGGIVLDHFAGSGTTLVAAKRLGQDYYGIDIMGKYCKIARKRLEGTEVALPKAG